MAFESQIPLVVGTHNRKKGAEIADLLAPLGIPVVTLDDLPDALEIPEDGDSFAANARLKASQQAVHLRRWVLADDSGLEVDALGGAPGVYSARLAGPHATDEANNRCLLEKLGDTPLEKRLAHYVCHISVADPTGAIQAESHDVCYGRIRFEPVGTNGFGYDPLFEIVEYHRTFGELGRRVKQALSHRSRALRAIAPKIAEAWSKWQ
ncbi:MAG TPA: non-canonical purine NTP pyrophosphatase [Lacipirellulaceae bacterium]|nr:non-canonical purine NTP pyrophosphatase [Lacipirellulaceae bacterium]